MSVTKVTSMMSTGTKGGDIPSASTLVIDTDGDFFDITGTTGITAMTVDAGRRFTLQFDGAVVLTHGSSLYLPGATNFTTEANDSLEFIATAANTVRCTGYALKDGGSPVVSLGGQYKFLTGTWDISTTGSLALTGVGFAPKHIILVAAVATQPTGNISMGNSDGTEFNLYDQHENAANDWGLVVNTKIVSIALDSGNKYAYLTVSSYDEDGITLSRTKYSTPTGTAHYGITFLG